MNVNPDVQQHHAKIIQSLAMAMPGTRKSETGYKALTTVATSALSEPLKDNLSEILVGEWNEDRSLFLAVVCDNNERPIEFESEGEALNQAIQLNDSLVKRYSYGLFATYGILASKLEAQQDVTLHFFKSGRP